MPDKILDYPEETSLLDDKTEADTAKKPISKKVADCCSGILENIRKMFKKKEQVSDGSKHYTLLDVFRNRTLTIYALVMCLLW